MLTIATAVGSLLLLSLTIAQAVCVFRYQSILTSNLSQLHDDDDSDPGDQPGDLELIGGPAAIVLCLRGADPTLVECLTGIVSQKLSKLSNTYCVGPSSRSSIGVCQ